MLAVKPWRKGRPPTGPISPLQNRPAIATPRNRSATSAASWSGTPNSPTPLPVRRHRVADLELDRLAHPRVHARDELARLAVAADEVADEEVAAFVSHVVLVHREKVRWMAHR